MQTFVTTLILLLVAIAYVLASRRAAPTKLRNRRLALFFTGWLTLAITLLPPFEQLADTRLSAHMIQHELLMIIVAPLIALARAHILLISVLTGNGRRVVARWIRALQPGMGIAWILHTAALWIWHLPFLYDAAVSRPLLHAAQHLSFFGSALLFWWGVLDRRTGYGVAALYVFATSVHSGLLGFLLFLAPRVWYQRYASGPGALEDQQLAGLIMWIPGGIALAITALLLLWYWLAEAERRVTNRQKLATASLYYDGGS